MFQKDKVNRRPMESKLVITCIMKDCWFKRIRVWCLHERLGEMGYVTNMKILYKVIYFDPFFPYLWFGIVFQIMISERSYHQILRSDGRDSLNLDKMKYIFAQKLIILAYYQWNHDNYGKLIERVLLPIKWETQLLHLLRIKCFIANFRDKYRSQISL